MKLHILQDICAYPPRLPCYRKDRLQKLWIKKTTSLYGEFRI